MKRTLAIASFAAAMIMASTGASAQTKAQATIPFDFAVGSTLMPSGLYDIESPQPGVIWLHEHNGQANVLSVAVTSQSVATPAKLIFNKYGDQYFLHETRAANGDVEMTLPTTKLEKRVRAQEARLENEQKTAIALK